MTCKRQLSLLPIFVALLFAADEAWKGKQIAEWSEDDVRQVLTDSPWAKTVKPTVDRSAHSSQGRSGGLGRGGIGIGGIGIGLPGMGGGRRGGMGGPGAGGGHPGGGRRGTTPERIIMSRLP